MLIPWPPCTGTWVPSFDGAASCPCVVARSLLCPPSACVCTSVHKSHKMSCVLISRLLYMLVHLCAYTWAQRAHPSIVVCTGMDLPAGFGRVFAWVRVRVCISLPGQKPGPARPANNTRRYFNTVLSHSCCRSSKSLTEMSNWHFMFQYQICICNYARSCPIFLRDSCNIKIGHL
jgi:hypothetical protein